MTKVRLREGDRSPLPILAYVLQNSLRLLHPIMPFVTETIWQHLRDRIAGLEQALIIAEYPTGDGETDRDAEEQVEVLMEVVRAIRNIRADRGVDPARFVEAYVATNGARPVLESGRPIVETLARVRPLHVIAEPGDAPSEQVASAVLDRAQVVVPLAGLIDIAAERDKLEKQLSEAQAQVQRIEGKLGNEQFRSKAPADVIAREEENLDNARSRVAGLQGRLSELD
jgi:valyl-tRNA synthetase